jgi:hypothetical protein
MPIYHFAGVVIVLFFCSPLLLIACCYVVFNMPRVNVCDLTRVIFDLLWLAIKKKTLRSSTPPTCQLEWCFESDCDFSGEMNCNSSHLSLLAFEVLADLCRVLYICSNKRSYTHTKLKRPDCRQSSSLVLARPKATSLRHCRLSTELVTPGSNMMTLTERPYEPGSQWHVTITVLMIHMT